MPRYNATRLWSYWECAKVVFEEWRHITTFLESNEEFADTSRQRLSQILMQNAVQLRVEPTSLMELERFFKATYTLEGDGHLIFIAFQKLEDPRSYSRSQFPNYPRCGSRTVSSEHWRPAKMVPVWPKGLCDACLSVFSEHFGE